MRATTKTITVFALATAALVGSGFAGTGYPVSGKWTYDGATESAAASQCNWPRHMKFDSNMRYDGGGGIREFKNTSTVQNGPGRYRIVDTFYNGQTRPM